MMREVPEGRLNGAFHVVSVNSIVPTGLVVPMFALSAPTSELVGYFRASLRDEICVER